ncbi:hypothetical protein I4F81_011776 [Pyropia yezoensis]|uniref:Uncharacterized protein n=1 Tax=Pyropia yezoensis TaxID=2788 RepID=A0ACC3CHK8_PYRYE|nr:hypothetical protein I4F81_011776 [Neopyropia yezoensis]
MLRPTPPAATGMSVETDDAVGAAVAGVLPLWQAHLLELLDELRSHVTLVQRGCQRFKRICVPDGEGATVDGKAGQSVLSHRGGSLEELPFGGVRLGGGLAGDCAVGAKGDADPVGALLQRLSFAVIDPSAGVRAAAATLLGALAAVAPPAVVIDNAAELSRSSSAGWWTWTPSPPPPPRWCIVGSPRGARRRHGPPGRSTYVVCVGTCIVQRSIRCYRRDTDTGDGCPAGGGGARPGDQEGRRRRLSSPFCGRRLRTRTRGVRGGIGSPPFPPGRGAAPSSIANLHAPCIAPRPCERGMSVWLSGCMAGLPAAFDSGSAQYKGGRGRGGGVVTRAGSWAGGVGRAVNVVAQRRVHAGEGTGGSPAEFSDLAEHEWQQDIGEEGGGAGGRGSGG